MRFLIPIVLLVLAACQASADDYQRSMCAAGRGAQDGVQVFEDALDAATIRDLATMRGHADTLDRLTDEMHGHVQPFTSPSQARDPGLVRLLSRIIADYWSAAAFFGSVRTVDAEWLEEARMSLASVAEVVRELDVTTAPLECEAPPIR